MKKLVSIIILVCMLSALALTGCSSAQTPTADSQSADAAAPAETAAAETETPKEPVTLKVGLLGKSVKPVGVLVADAMGYFDEEGVKVEFEKVSSMNDKRTGRQSIETAVEFTKERFGVDMPVSRPRCEFFPKNKECLHERCPYFPTGSIKTGEA